MKKFIYRGYVIKWTERSYAYFFKVYKDNELVAERDSSITSFEYGLNDCKAWCDKQ